MYATNHNGYVTGDHRQIEFPFADYPTREAAEKACKEAIHQYRQEVAKKLGRLPTDSELRNGTRLDRQPYKNESEKMRTKMAQKIVPFALPVEKKSTADKMEEARRPPPKGVVEKLRRDEAEAKEKQEQAEQLAAIKKAEKHTVDRLDATNNSRAIRDKYRWAAIDEPEWDAINHAVNMASNDSRTGEVVRTVDELRRWDSEYTAAHNQRLQQGMLE